MRMYVLTATDFNGDTSHVFDTTVNGQGDATLTAMATFDAVNIDTLTDANFANFTGI